jgi:hypothetical protein
VVPDSLVKGFTPWRSGVLARAWRLAAYWLAALAWSTPSLAQDEGGDNATENAGSDADTESATNGSAADPDFGHQGQFGVRLGLAWGYRMVFRYDESPLCRKPDPTNPFEEQQQFCGHSGPFALDTGLSFAIVDSIEPFVWGRFGLGGEAETNTAPVLILGAGLRIYTMSDSAFKIFVEPAVGFGLEGDAGDEAFERNPNGLAWQQPEHERELLFHLAAGPHWDFHENFGAYLTGGITAGIVRSINASLELQLGVQGRIP